MLMENEKEILTNNKNNFQNEKDLQARKPNLNFPKNNVENNKEPPPNDLIQEALKIVLSQQEEIYCQREQLHQELQRLKEQLNSVLIHLEENDVKGKKKHESLKILTSSETTLTEKVERAELIIRLHNTDL